MTSVYRSTLLHGRPKRGIRYSWISFPVIITDLVSMSIMMQINTVTGGHTGHGHSVTFLFVLMLVDLPNRSIRRWSRAMKRRRQHRWRSIKMWETIRIRECSCNRSRINLMWWLTLVDDLGITIELRWRNDWFSVVMVIMLDCMVLVLRLSFKVEYLRRFRRLDFNSNTTVGVAQVGVFRWIPRGRVPVTHATLLHLLDVHGDAVTRVKPRIRPRRISVEPSANWPQTCYDDHWFVRASFEIRKPGVLNNVDYG